MGALIAHVLPEWRGKSQMHHNIKEHQYACHRNM